jgi:prevent-host-death family protein
MSPPEDVPHVADTAQVNVHEAKTQLSRLLKRVEQGEEITISRAGQPVARLVPLRASRPERKLGLWKGRVWIADDFDETSEDLIAAFEGE